MGFGDNRKERLHQVICSGRGVGAEPGLGIEVRSASDQPRDVQKEHSLLKCQDSLACPRHRGATIKQENVEML